jgi:hypothetical protein
MTQRPCQQSLDVYKIDTNNKQQFVLLYKAGNTKGGSITVLLTSCLTGLESAV